MGPNKKKVFLFTDWYLPGYKAGGPIQSCRNIVKALQAHYEFYIFTSDRDWGESKPYPGIPVNRWIAGDDAIQIFYATPDFLTVKNLAMALSSIGPDIVYFNSMFSQHFTLMPLWMLIQTKFSGRITLAPRGMLQAGALMRKSLKKRIFLNLFKLSGMPGKIIFHATDEQEKKDILSFFPQAKAVLVAENIPNIYSTGSGKRSKISGELKMVFVSRIHPKKNLHYILEVLRSRSYAGRIWLDIYGLAEDEAYLAKCKSLVADMPANILINFSGPLAHAEVFDVLRNSHLFVLPTLGENFGHAIFESLSTGTPVLISDHTPWRNMEEKFAGWDITLSESERYSGVIDYMLQMDENYYKQWSCGARQYSEQFLANFDYITKYTSLFQ
jgi:Glycosyltransferase